MKHYSAIKKENQAQIYTITQINLRYILLSERKVKVLDTKLYRSLCNPMDCSPPGSSVHGIFQTRILEWFAIAFSKDRPDPGIKPRSPASQVYCLPSEPPGKLDTKVSNLCDSIYMTFSERETFRDKE